MKKIALSALVIFSFIVYALHQKQEAKEAISNLSPKSAPTEDSVENSGTSAGSETLNPNTAPVPQTTPTPSTAQGNFKDGAYTGNSVDVFYGFVQVRAVISGGKLTDVQFLSYPNDRSTSREISNFSLPILKSEAIANQSATVDTVSGATSTSGGFRESLKSALDKARI